MLDFKTTRRGPGAVSGSVLVVIGPFHVEHVFVDEDDAPFVRRSRVARTGESDLIRVETNVVFPQVEGDMASWACHNLAEAIALELAVGDDYLDTKSRLCAIIADQSGMATALRRSAKARITAVDADCALEGEPASPR